MRKTYVMPTCRLLEVTPLLLAASSRQYESGSSKWDQGNGRMVLEGADAEVTEVPWEK